MLNADEISFLKEFQDLVTQPVSSRTEVLWDVKVNVKSQGRLERISSNSHAIQVDLPADEKSAVITLASDIDKRTVPFNDFVLYLRDEMVNTPIGLLH